ncbi:MAG: PilZ domain-containing protein [Pseudomonadota bacterium]
MTDSLQVHGISIERRWSQRRAAMLNVEIHQQGVLIACCRVCNVGLGGAFIDSVTSMLSKGSEFDLVFCLGDAQKVRHRLHAKVVRVGAEGLGVGFRDFDTSAFRALQEVMRHAASPFGSSQAA